MATHSQLFEENLRRCIRDIKAIDPLTTNVALVDKLNVRFGHSSDPRYIKRLASKVDRALMVESDRAKIEERLTDIRENYRMVRQRLHDIICWNSDEHPGERKPANKDVIEAAKNIVMLDLAVLSAEIANGLYKRPLDVIAKQFTYEPLPPEVRAVIIAGWIRGGLLPQAVVDRMVPELPANGGMHDG
jgi:hypothetical protein